MKICQFTTIILGIIFGASAVGQQQTLKGYTINVYLKGLQDNTTLYLTCTSSNGSGLDTISTTQSRGDYFTFSGHVALEGQAHFIFIDTMNTAYKHLRKKYLLIHLENSIISIKGSIDNMSPLVIEVSGSKVHEELISFARQDLDKAEKISSRYNALAESRMEIIRLKDSSDEALTKISELDDQMKAIKKEHIDFKTKWVESHSNSLIAPWISLQLPDSLQAALYLRFPANIQDSYYGLELKKQLLRSDRTATGRMAPELLLKTPNGEDLSLLSIAKKHKLTILDFWAYWCGPCRASFPDLKKKYAKYHSKGLAIYGVSIDPRKPAWLKAIKDDNLPWYNVIVPEKGKNPAKELYGISAVPTSFLLDQQGNILLRWTGEDNNGALEKYLSRL